MPFFASLAGAAAGRGIKALRGKKKKSKGPTGKGGVREGGIDAAMSTNGKWDDDDDDDGERGRRRRRRRLLTAQDKADIAFIVGVLGKGQAGQTAIASMLARRS